MGKRARFQVRVESSEFFSLETYHPYGVLPGGNRFFGNPSTTASCDIDAKNPTDLMGEDEVWMLVLSYCDATCLARLSQTCCYFYVAGHQPELWRDLVLRALEKDVISKMCPSWKDTFVSSVAKVEQDKYHSPMRVSGVYSEYFHRLHSCRSFALPENWKGTETDSVVRISVGELKKEEFFEKFERPNTPVIVSGAAKGWNCFKKWKDPRYIAEQTGDKSFRATSGVAPLPSNFSLEAYLDYCKVGIFEEAPLYLFDRSALKPGSKMWNDYMPDLQRSCPWWDPESSEHDLFKLLGEGKRPDHTWLIAGPKRSGSVFHIDPNCTHAWNAAICGRKRWLFYPPGVAPPGVHPTADGDEVALPLSLGEWLLTFWEEHEERKRSSPRMEQPLECTAMPGDVLFVPHGWWHAVINLDDLNIAITHNYVSDSNLPNVLRFLREKQDQISGCRDRQESIKPENLLIEFEKKLEKTYPKKLHESKQVTDWTCAAWRPKNKFDVSAVKRTKVDTGQSVMNKAKLPESSSFSFSFL